MERERYTCLLLYPSSLLLSPSEKHSLCLPSNSLANRLPPLQKQTPAATRRCQGLVILNKWSATIHFFGSISSPHLFISLPVSYPPQAKWQVEEFAPSDQVTAQMPQPNAAHSSSLPLTLCLLRFLFLDRRRPRGQKLSRNQAPRPSCGQGGRDASRGYSPRSPSTKLS